jgi:hypothetical protein
MGSSQTVVVSREIWTSVAAAPQVRVVVELPQQSPASAGTPFKGAAINSGSRTMVPVFSCKWAA